MAERVKIIFCNYCITETVNFLLYVILGINFLSFSIFYRRRKPYQAIIIWISAFHLNENAIIAKVI